MASVHTCGELVPEASSALAAQDVQCGIPARPPDGRDAAEALGTVTDFLQRQELGRHAHCVANGATEQAAGKAVEQAIGLWNAAQVQARSDLLAQ
jgi:hypothetical protein